MRRAALVLLIPTFLWAVDAALGLGTFAVHDLRHHHVPWRVWAAGEWLAGRVPLWAPGVAHGFPLMADGQAGAFYPPTMLLFMALPSPWALNAALLLHLWWAAVGAWVLARRLGRSAEAAWVAAIAYGFSGFLATHALYLGMLAALAWLPWTVAAVVARRPGLAGLAAWMMLVAGHPQAAAFGLLAVGVVAVRQAWIDRRWPVGFAVAMALALVAAAPQLLATLELQRFGMRDGGVPAAFANIGSLPPQELINGVLPRFFGYERPGDVPQTYFHRAGLYWGSGENHWEMAFYLGVPVVVLAVLGARRAWFWVALAGAALVLMLGGHTPAWPLLRHLPGLSGFRFPVRFGLVLTLATSVLAAAGADRVLAASPEERARWAGRTLRLAALFLAGLVVGRVMLVLAEDEIRGRLTEHFLARAEAPPPPDDLPPLQRAALPGPEPLDPSRIPAKVDAILASLEADTTPWALPALVPLLALLATALALRRGGRVGVLALAALAWADLRTFGGDYQVRVSPSVLLDEPPALPVIRAAGGRGRTTVVDRRRSPELDGELMSASLGLLWGTRDVIVTSPLLVLRNDALLSLVGLDVGDRGRVKVRRLARWPRIVDLLGVRWLLSVHDLAGAGYPRRGGTDRVGLYENEDPLEGAWLVPCARPTDDPWSEITALDPRAEALVEGVSAAALGPLAAPDCGDGPVGEARILAETPVGLDVEVRAERPALLVQNDAFYPGWRATLDGEPVPLLRVDLLFRGVVVGPGAHRLELRYQPGWFRPALAGMVLGLLGLLAMAAGRARRWPWARSSASAS